MTKHIAITGSFASGKSFVLECLQSMGYSVFSCDEYIRELYKDENLQKLVVDSIDGLDVFDKQKLVNIIYDDTKSRRKLESIIHPMVRAGIKNFEAKNLDKKIIFSEVPLLFESGFNKYFDHNICVYCSEKTRIKRAKIRGVKDDELFKKITKTQLPQEEKKILADFTIDSEMNAAEIKEILNGVLESVKTKH